MESAQPSDIVIIGAGIIGLATAYYLTEASYAPSSIHVIEISQKLFASASGHAAGFIARDWFGPATASLASLSYQAHEHLAASHDGHKHWGYSRSVGHSIVRGNEAAGEARGEDWLMEGRSRVEMRDLLRPTKAQHGPRWLKRQDGARLETISTSEDTSQVHPRKLCDFLLEECRSRGINIVHPAQPTQVSRDPHGRIIKLRVLELHSRQTIDVPCSRLVITAGAWSPEVFSALFPEAPIRIPITSLAGHSLIVRNPAWDVTTVEDECHAVFATDMEGFSPEVFGRVGGEIYIAGLNTTEYTLPKHAQEAQPYEESIARLQRVACTLLGLEDRPKDLVITGQGLCFRPMGPNMNPIIAHISNAQLGTGERMAGNRGSGVFVSAGHGPWGIALSLGTGICLSELILGKPLSADIAALALDIEDHLSC